ncbi:hypothetical protein HID58_012374 [Brassica napus]|uniref:RING-type domain-containing protein n=1 Tax=Brassica napus TaxID=3708 RepID=A0ABQ8E1F6_BRANA|nr:hypothetical protein HID58_012374 [Brassica napus]
MENQKVSCHDDELSLNHIVDEEDFRSCCGDEQLWLKETDDNTAKVQKKLDFYAQDSVANYLALLDGLTVALENNLHSVKTSSLDGFVLKLAPLCDLDQALTLARVAVGICNVDVVGNKQDRRAEIMLTLKCTHKFCSHCMKTYVQGRVESSEVPIRCPQVQCNNHLSASECKLFLPVASFRSFEEAKMRCEEFQILPVDDITLHRLARYKRWRRCHQCRVMVELAQGCNHMTCRCGHGFCYCCGGEYREGQQSCTCDFWDDEKEEEYQENTIQELEQWPWDAFSSMPSVMDAYSEQERSQLALIQRFLAGGGDHHTFYQSPPPQPPCRESSYVEAAMKDIHQLPWLERFVSVISDDYYEEYINSQ